MRCPHAHSRNSSRRQRFKIGPNSPTRLHEEAPQFPPLKACSDRGLGRVDGFDQDEAEGERDEGTVIARSLLATKGDALEALEFADGLLDARPRFVEDFREESGSVGCSRAMRNDRTNAALAGAVAIGFGVVPLSVMAARGKISGPMSSRSSKLRLSLASPPVRWKASGKPSRSTLRWILVEKPPRERPSA